MHTSWYPGLIYWLINVTGHPSTRFRSLSSRLHCTIYVIIYIIVTILLNIHI